MKRKHTGVHSPRIPLEGPGSERFINGFLIGWHRVEEVAVDHGVHASLNHLQEPQLLATFERSPFQIFTGRTPTPRDNVERTEGPFRQERLIVDPASRQHRAQ